MRSIPALNDEQWLELLEQVAKTFNEVTLSRGFNYFKQQRVATLNISEDRVVKASVTGSEDYTVTLYLDKFKSSSCTCPVRTSCKHLAAVMMELADRLGYPASQIVNARHQVKRSSMNSSSGSLLEQLPGADISSWHETLNQITGHFKPTYDQGIYADLLRVHLQNIRKSSIPFTAIDRFFFELHKELFIVRKIKEQNASSTSYHFTSYALYRNYDEILTWLRKESANFSAMYSDAGARLEQTLAYLRQQMAVETGRKYLDFSLYTTLWKHWISPQPDVRYLATLEIDAIEKQPLDSLSASLSAAKAFLLLQQSRSSESWATLEASGKLKEAPLSLYLPFLGQLSDSRDWGLLVDWLIKTAPYFYGQRTKELDNYMGYWKVAVAHVPEAEEEMWRVLEEMLPHSSRIIEDMLYEQGKWKPWVEMQILQGHDPLYHRVSVLQPIEKEAPDLLLPYYHQAISQYVLLKNRHDYKLAVKLLKRLEKVYKKMKQTDRWERFFDGFMERHSRLRALQEELKKGKLLE
ncbi:SWIM zinc finger domain-containing protein [Paenibacillus sp. GCM10027628]|uniref:SWIM zinc finger family protein n=1 Tax=Paenibacillus sp. GCM10027628 TaxID=3273413 RepID=UPI0036437248